MKSLCVAACTLSWAKQWYAEAHAMEEGSGMLQLGQVQRRMRRHRTIFTEEQLDALEELFLQNQYPDINTREQLAQRTQLREERVEVSLSLFSGPHEFHKHSEEAINLCSLLTNISVTSCSQSKEFDFLL